MYDQCESLYSIWLWKSPLNDIWQVFGPQQLHWKDPRRIVQASVFEGAVCRLQSLNSSQIKLLSTSTVILCMEAHDYVACCRYVEGNQFRPGTRSKGTHKVLELPEADVLV